MEAAIAWDVKPKAGRERVHWLSRSKVIHTALYSVKVIKCIYLAVNVFDRRPLSFP